MSNGSCTMCKEVITNPICPDCVQREIVAWLRDNDPSQIDNAKDVAMLFTTTTYSSTCIVCNRKMGVCPFCTTFQTKDLLNLNTEDFDDTFGLRLYELDQLAPF